MYNLRTGLFFKKKKKLYWRYFGLVLIAYDNGFRLVFKIISIGGSQVRQLGIRYCKAGC